MSVPVAVDRLAADRTPMSTCQNCCSPVDASGRATSLAYIRMVENDHEKARESLALVIATLGPFAAMANRYDAGALDSTVVMAWQDKPIVTLGDLRRARHHVDLF